MKRVRTFTGLLLAAVAALVGCSSTGNTPAAPDPRYTAMAERTPSAGQPQFGTPAEAVEALLRDVRARDRTALRQLFGVEMALLEHREPVLDDAELARFDHDLSIRRDLVDVPEMPGVKAIVVGSAGWVFPVPLVERDGRWFFDGEVAANEVALRRIGANELRTIAVCQALVLAQQEYFAEDRDGDGVREFAQRIMSTPNRRDGLYWPTGATTSPQGEEIYEEPSPVGPALAQASNDVPLTQRKPYHGYFYRLLPRQGPGAVGGEKLFAPDGQGTGGFAFLAFPAVYGVTGVTTFMVGQDGVVYEFDLGPETLAIAEAVEVYDPGGWRVAE